MEVIKLQLLITQYRTWDKKKLMECLKFRIDSCPQLGKGSKGEMNMKVVSSRP
jgi:hypothetical protein